MKKEDFKLKQSTKDMFTGTQVATLLEDVDHKLEFIGEKVVSMESRLDRMETKLDATFEAVRDIKSELSVMKEKDIELDRRIVVLEKRATV